MLISLVNVSNPATSWPKIVCWKFRCCGSWASVRSVSVMKNWESPVSSPELAIAKRPGLLKVSSVLNSSSMVDARAAGAVAVRVAALRHEAVDDPVESQVVVKPLVDERDDPVNRHRGEVIEEAEGQVAGEGVVARVLAGYAELDRRAAGNDLGVNPRIGARRVVVHESRWCW